MCRNRKTNLSTFTQTTAKHRELDGAPFLKSSSVAPPQPVPRNVNLRDIPQFLASLRDEQLWEVIIRSLTDRGADPNRVDRRAARLNLALAPANPRFVIHKLAR